jgi:S1-C subfamily serine protease
MRLVLILLILLQCSGCNRWYLFDFEKPAGVREIHRTYDLPAEIQKRAKFSPLTMQVRFPESTQTKALTLKLAIKVQHNGVVDFKFSGPYCIQNSAVQGSVIRLELGELEKHSRSKDDLYASPAEFLEEADVALAPIGSMNRVSLVPGGSTRESVACSGIVVGENLVMTNHHCISSQDECLSSTFTFWNQHEVDSAGAMKKRSFACQKLVLSDEYFDFSIIRVDNDPSVDFKPRPWMKNDIDVPVGTPVYVATNNPQNQKTLKPCLISGEDQIVRVKDEMTFRFEMMKLACTSPVIPGDSGSPVLNFNGDLLGIVWGSGEGDEAYYPALTPISVIIQQHQKALERLRIPFISRAIHGKKESRL